MVIEFYDTDTKLADEPIYTLEVTEEEYWFIERAYDDRLCSEDPHNNWALSLTPYLFFDVYYYEFVKDVLERKRASDKVDSLVKDL